MKWIVASFVFVIAAFTGFSSYIFNLSETIAAQSLDKLENQALENKENEVKDLAMLNQVLEFYKECDKIQKWILKHYKSEIKKPYEISDYVYDWVEVFEKSFPSMNITERNSDLINILKSVSNTEKSKDYTNYIFWYEVYIETYEFANKEELLWYFSIAEERNMETYLPGVCEDNIGPIDDTYDSLLYADDSLELYYYQLYKKMIEALNTDDFKYCAMSIIKSTLFRLKAIEDKKSELQYNNHLKLLSKYVEYEKYVKFPSIDDPKFSSFQTERAIEKLIPKILDAKWDKTNNKFVLQTKSQPK